MYPTFGTHLQHPILIEAAMWKVDLGVGPWLELPVLLRDHRVDACRSQALQMILTCSEFRT